MDEALDSGRGYYELMTDINTRPIVLRFNIKAFRNNYSISDLIKMNLDYHAIKVGCVEIESLAMASEFNKIQGNEPTGLDLLESSPSNDKPIDVYDVILAGVSK